MVLRRPRGLSYPAAGIAAKVMLASVLLGASKAEDEGIPSDYTVVHANVIMRHGERSRLVKTTAQEFGFNDGVTLTAMGEEQCYMIGEQLRRRYLLSDDLVTTNIEGVPLFYDADRVQVISSGYERTLESASALALGLYPPGQNDTDVADSTLLWNNHIIVPIHSSDPENDMVILGSDKCPVYEDNWHETYRLDTFSEKEAEAEDWVNDVHAVFESYANAGGFPQCWEEVVALKEDLLKLHAPYNLWDCARVLLADGETQTKNYIDEVPPPAETAALTGFDYLEELVLWIEDRKYAQGVIGRMGGGLYIGEMYARMSEVVTHFRSGRKDTVGRFSGMHITVGHYPTLKSIAGALDIGGLQGIPDYASHLTFELLYNATADFRNNEDDFAVRIMYQDSTDPVDLHWVQMSPIFDDEQSLGIDDELALARDPVTGIMGWNQFGYLMEHQVAGGPAYYAGGEGEWCTDCLATEPDTCLRLELETMTQLWEAAVGEADVAVEEKEAVDDGVEGYHVALLSIFGVLIGVGIGICVRPCIDHRNLRAKEGGSVVGGNRGLEAWSGTSNGHNRNGSFRLAAKNTPTRHVLGGANGSRAMAVPTSDVDDLRGNGDAGYGAGDIEDVGAGTRIPAFAPTSALGEPVPFPHRRQPSNMISGVVDSSMMTGVDADTGDDVNEEADLTRTTSRELLDYY